MPSPGVFAHCSAFLMIFIFCAVRSEYLHIENGYSECAHAYACKEYNVPAQTNLTICPSTFTANTEIKINFASLNLHIAEDYSSLVFLVKVYTVIDGEPEIMFGRKLAPSCSKIKEEIPFPVPCPGKKGQEISIKETDISRFFDFSPSAGDYIAQVKVENEKKQLLTCFNLKASVKDSDFDNHHL